MFDSNAVTYDHSTGEQVPVEKAYFVLRTDVKTPRGYGIVAFKDKAQAEAFSAAHGKGKVVKWYQIVDETLK
jgi:nitrous oxide reductase accessory protein NosL